MEIIVATRNTHKMREVRDIMQDTTFTLLSLVDFPDAPLLNEEGDSYRENAKIKAEVILNWSGKVVLADDSGLEVDALGGNPGVYSSRFCGKKAKFREKNLEILRLLKDVPFFERKARFVCVVAVGIPGKEIMIVEGICEGLIAFEAKGEHGFGYDPIFYIPEIGKTMAQLTLKEKNRISHRAKAFNKAKELLNQFKNVSL